jgi:hypothetical protein
MSRRSRQDFKSLVPSYVTYKPAFVGHILFNGKLIRTSAKYGCFMTISGDASLAEVPHNLKVR